MGDKACAARLGRAFRSSAATIGLAMRRTLLSASIVALSIGCHGTESTNAQPGASVPAPSSSSLAPPPATAPVSVVTGTMDAGLAALPEIGSRKKLGVYQGQGGPKQVRCNGTVSELEIDLQTNAWKYGVCLADKGEGAETAPLVTRKGRLSKADRAKVDAAYGLLRVIPAPRCASDAGAFVLSLQSGDGGTERYSCREPFGLVGGNAINKTLMEIVDAQAP